MSSNPKRWLIDVFSKLGLSIDILSLFCHFGLFSALWLSVRCLFWSVGVGVGVGVGVSSVGVGVIVGAKR